MQRKLWGVCSFRVFSTFSMILRYTKPIILSTVPLLLLLLLFGCGADPGSSASVPSTSYAEPRKHAVASPEVPAKTVARLQECADRYAKRLSGESYGILIDVQANESGHVAAVKINDSMLKGSEVEQCLVDALEDMAVPASTMKMGQSETVSPQSRRVTGIVQAAAAPIAMLPIVLVSAGVTILVGVTIYVAVKAVDATAEYQRCKEVKEKCIDHCSGPAGLPAPGGGKFRLCMRECMQSQGCSF